MPSGKEVRTFVRIVFICVGWYVVSSSNGVIGKWILTDFPYPMTLTMCQLMSVAVYSGPVLSMLGIRSSKLDVPWSYYLKYVIPLAFAKFLSNVLAHVSIWKVPVSFAHTVKASMPLFTVLLSRLLIGEKHSFKVYASLVPIMCGVAIASLTEVSFDMLGLTSALSATAGFSLMNILTKKVLKETGVHQLHMLYVLGRLSCLLFLPLWLFVDLGNILSSDMFFNKDGDRLTVNVLLLLLVDGILHWLQNILAFTLLKLVAPLTYAVANVTKRVSVITVSILMLRNHVTTLNVCGIVIAVAGVFLYNKVKYEENKARHAMLPTSMSLSSSAKRNRPMPTNVLLDHHYEPHISIMTAPR